MQNVNKSLNESLQAKYPHLELSVLSLSQVQKDNEKNRIDAEFFSKNFIGAYEKIKNVEFLYLGDCLSALTDYHSNGSYEILNANVTIKDEKDYAYMIRSTDCEKMDFENEVKYVSRHAYNFLSKTKIFGGEILINKIGNPGSTYFVPYLNKPTTLGMNLFLLKTNDKLNNAFLYIFLNTKIGKLIIERKINGAVPQTIDKEAIKTLPIPQFSQEFQLEIEKLVKDSHKALEDSKALYKEAERLLYESLGLDSPLYHTNAPFRHTERDKREVSKPRESKSSNESMINKRIGKLDSHLQHCDSSDSISSDLDSSLVSLAQNDNVNSPSLAEGVRGWVKKYPHLNLSIRPLSQSYGISGRLDSEYYQTKYDAIERKIRGFSHKKLGDLVTIQKSIEPGSEAYQNEGIEFVRVANLSKFGISKSDICLSKQNFAKELEKLAPKKETILLSKDGSIGISYCLEEDLECITSGAILHLKVKDKSEILPQVLSLILNSIAVKLQAERDSGGSIIAHWKISEIENVLIPLLDFKLQEQIALKIQKSFSLRKKAKDLLKTAKFRVENAIENEGKNA